mmetsp:Transcript_19454/g.47043  ORF Transcript_19454/g.47043 Transcript_19454/m.47043 type:complete len:130 (-) Transcript_19454:626-1015(-)
MDHDPNEMRCWCHVCHVGWGGLHSLLIGHAGSRAGRGWFVCPPVCPSPKCGAMDAWMGEKMGGSLSHSVDQGRAGLGNTHAPRSTRKPTQCPETKGGRPWPCVVWYGLCRINRTKYKWGWGGVAGGMDE